jgi:hypothetical protein
MIKAKPAFLRILCIEFANIVVSLSWVRCCPHTCTANTGFRGPVRQGGQACNSKEDNEKAQEARNHAGGSIGQIREISTIQERRDRELGEEDAGRPQLKLRYLK